MASIKAFMTNLKALEARKGNVETFNGIVDGWSHPNQAEFGKMGGEIRSKNIFIAGVFHVSTFITGTMRDIRPTIFMKVSGLP